MQTVMRSLVVTTWFPDSDHPARTPFCLAHVRALQHAGLDVEVVHVKLGESTSPYEETYKGIPLIRVGLQPAAFGSWWSVWRLIRKKLATVDVLHTMAFSSILVAALPWLLQRRPWVHTEHWNGVVRPSSVSRSWQALAFLRHVLRLPHVVTGVTQELGDEMARFARPRATKVVPCVVNSPREIEPFPPAPPLRLIGIGLVTERKNPLLALETIAWLRERGVEVQYEWVGDGPLMTTAVRRAEELDLRGVVHFSGAVDPSQVASKINSAHMFFVPSSQENFFTALAEAITLGRPAIAPRSGGFVDYCTCRNSHLTDELGVEALGSAILDAWTRFKNVSPDEIAGSVKGRFSVDAVAERFRDIYGSLG